MDQDVIKAMARWPNVPAVHGWLSLDARGRWRLHPLGDAAQGGPGEPIGNPAILAFMDRNYAHDESGRWFFQNGPQRVFVRVDGAPYVLRRADQGPGLATHTGLAVAQVVGWWADTSGRLFASTERGPGLIEDRELSSVLETMRDTHGNPLIDHAPGWLLGDAGAAAQRAIDVEYPPYGRAPLAPLCPAQLESSLGFVANPLSSRTA